MNEINLTSEEIVKILAVVNELNPGDTTMVSAGRVTIRSDNSSGIGTIVTATIPMKCGNYWGDFTTIITDVDSW